MRKFVQRQLAFLTAVFLVICGVTSCLGIGAGPSEGKILPTAKAAASEKEKGKAQPQAKLVLSAFHIQKATKVEGGAVDLSAASQGYIAVRVKSGNRLKFQIINDDETYTYDLPSNGRVTVFPVNMGDGTYRFRLMRQVEGSKYTEAWSDSKSVTLADEYVPYLRPNQMSQYNDKSNCVSEAYKVTKSCKNDLETAGAIYEYLAKTITYDYDKAETVKSGYLPDPDSTLRSKKGICFDYASLAAAMMRSQGIPCQVITGYLGADELYHAWNRFYLKNKGWLTVEIPADAKSWKRVDITAAAAGSKPKDLEDDQQYTTRYIY